MKKKARTRKGSGGLSHFSWPDWLVLAGAAILVPVAIYERRWFFLVIGLAIAAALGIRVMVTRALAQRAASGEKAGGERDGQDDTPRNP